MLQDNWNHLHARSRTRNAWAKDTDSPSHCVYLLTLLPLFCRIFLRVCTFQHFFFWQEHRWRPGLSCKESEEQIFSDSWVDCASKGRWSLSVTEEQDSDAIENTSFSGKTEDGVTRPWGTSMWARNGFETLLSLPYDRARWARSEERETLFTAPLTCPSKQVNTAHS